MGRKNNVPEFDFAQRPLLWVNLPMAIRIMTMEKE